METRFLLTVPRRLDLTGPSTGTAVVPLDDPKRWAQRFVTLWTNAPDRVVSLGHGGNLAIGTVFSDAGIDFAKIFAANGNKTDAVAEHLIRYCWGAYLALLNNGVDRQLLLLRDPLGTLPVYRTMTNNHIAYASDIGLFVEAGILDPAVDFEAVYEHLRTPDRRRLRTCLTGIAELPPGRLVRATGDLQSSTSLWSPWKFTSPPRNPSFREATERLHQVVTKTISSWASQCGKIVVPVSGGLDSSIICAALAAAGQDFACVTIATDDPSGDERRYARILATHFGVELIENRYDVYQIDPRRSMAAHLPRPVMKPFVQETHRVFTKAASTLGAAQIFDGNGGDNVFCYLHSSSPISDRLRREGPGIGLLRTAADMSRITGVPMPTLARKALRHILALRPNYAAPTRPLLLNPDYCTTFKAEDVAPNLSTSTEHQHGKLAHVAQILAIRNLTEGYDRTGGVALFSPLVSQPIVEVCLAIPTWLWCQGGVNRAVARAAFRSTLPEQITRRTAKAGPDSFVHAIYRTYRQEIRTFLLDGLLASNHVIDRPAVERATAADGAASSETLYRLLELADAEAWAKVWK